MKWLELIKKICIVSHVLPPSPSGQAMVLYRLFRDMPADRYCLISRENYAEALDRHSATRQLPGRYYVLKPSIQIQVKHRFNLDKPTTILNVALQILSMARQIKDIVRKEHCDAIVVCTGDIYDLPAASLAGRWSHTPVIPYMFDDYVYQWTDFNRTMARFMEPSIIKKSRSVIVPNEFTKEEYHKRYGIDAIVIHNPCEMPDLEKLDASDDIFNDHETAIVYMGAVYHAHYDAFRNLINALKRLPRNKARLHVFTAQTEEELKQNGLAGPELVYHPHIPQSEVPRVLRKADILFLPLAFDSPIPEVIRTSAPGKTGEYLSAGRPILVHAPLDSFVSWYFMQYQCGTVVGESDPKMLADALDRMISDPSLQTYLGRRAREQAEKDFDVNVMISKFIQRLNAMAGGIP